MTLVTRGRGAPDPDVVELIAGVAPDITSTGAVTELVLGAAPDITSSTGVVTVLLEAGAGIPVRLTLAVPVDPKEELGADIMMI
uniref:Uncharacterized protein n=1 Tax=Amphimedon queenslandica TaxID=400682 RepID=A0A1X7SLD4_AMPQE